jgi:outer membrane protein OmpA-like peptidoglycan-associated protein
MRRAYVVVLVSLLLISPCFAQNPDDAENCKDSPIIERMRGSKINSCENKEFEQFSFPLKPDADGNTQEKKIEGEYHSWDYATREGMSNIQLYRNFTTALKKAGFTIDYPNEPETITAHKGNTWIYIEDKETYYYQTIVTAKEMEQEVTADAASLGDEIKKSGHVAVYGINFDTGKATIQPSSESVLNEIVKLLQDDSSLKLRVEGHTDNVGAAAANQALSEKRAQAVVAWLTQHGIAANRLTAKGFGATKPIADNNTDEGKAKNRRVELAKM